MVSCENCGSTNVLTGNGVAKCKSCGKRMLIGKIVMFFGSIMC